MSSLKSLFGSGSRRRSRRGGAYRPRYRPSEHPTRLRLIPGEYRHPNGDILEVGFVAMHYSPKIQKSFVCSAKWTDFDNNDGRCIGCYASTAAQLPGNDPKIEEYRRLNINTSIKYPVTVFVMEDFHLDPLDWKGNDMGYNDKGEHKLRKVMCTHDNDCDGCKRGLKTEWGRRLIWELPPTHLDILLQTIDQYQDYCGRCGSQGLEISDAICPECGESLPGLGKSGVCRSCGKKVEPMYIYHCPRCGDSGRVPTIFDADWVITSTVKDSFPSIVPARLDIKPISDKIPEDMRKPLDFSRYYEPMSLGAQSMLLGVPNPFLDSSSFSYGDEDDGDDDKGGNVPF